VGHPSVSWKSTQSKIRRSQASFSCGRSRNTPSKTGTASGGASSNSSARASMGAHYRHTTPEMAARVVAAIQTRPSVVVTTAVEIVEAHPALASLGCSDSYGPCFLGKFLANGGSECSGHGTGRGAGPGRSCSFGVEPPAGTEPATPSFPFVWPRTVIEDAEVKWPEASVADRGEPVASCSQWHQLGRWARPVQGDTSSGEILLDRRTAVRGALPLCEEVVRPQRTKKARSYALLATPNV
jgi:hypothetical protein